MWGLNADICNVENSLLQGYTGIWHATGHNARFLCGDISSAILSTYILTFGLTFYADVSLLQQFAGILSGIRSGVRVLCGILWRIRRDSCGSKILIYFDAGHCWFHLIAADFFGMRCSFGTHMVLDFGAGMRRFYP